LEFVRAYNELSGMNITNQNYQLRAFFALKAHKLNINWRDYIIFNKNRLRNLFDFPTVPALCSDNSINSYLKRTKKSLLLDNLIKKNLDA